VSSNQNIEDKDKYSDSSENGNGQITKADSAEMRPSRPKNTLSNREETSLFTATNFGQSVVFQQSKVWSRAIVWGIIGITAGLITWACFARLEEAVSAQGKLEPVESVKKIQSPISGVVKKVFVKNGDKVKAGDVLMQLESALPESQLVYLNATKVSLEQANSFYRSQMNPNTANNVDVGKLNIKADILNSTKNRSALVAENKLYRAELSGNTATLTPEQRSRLQSNLNELQTRISSGKLGVGQTQKQRSENRAKRQGLLNQIESSRANMSSIKASMESNGKKNQAELGQVEEQLNSTKAGLLSAQQVLASDRKILNGLKPAAAQGAIAQVQVESQEQKVNKGVENVNKQTYELSRLRQEINRLKANGQSDRETQQQRYEEQNQQIKQRTSEIAQLDEEYARLGLSASQGEEKVKNDVAVTQKDLYAKLSENDKQIKAIDSQLSKEIVENDKKLAEINNQLTQANQNLKYQDIRSPADGTVFELKAYNDGVVNNNSSEPLLQVVPDNNLIAKVFILNKDIGFVTGRFAEAQKNKESLEVDVRIDSFNFSEFGDVKGTLEWIGSDVLPPDETNREYRFPARIKLKDQSLNIKQSTGSKDMPLKTGMSINANIKLRDRTVMSIFTEQFTRQSDSLKNVR
jgi:hemolysin D